MEVDSFITPSLFVEGQMRFVLIPSFYDVSVLRYEDGDLSIGKDFHCIGAALSFDYSINRDWIFYIVGTAMHAQGKVFDFNNGVVYSIQDGLTRLASINSGFGYDLITGDKWSIPAFLGFTGRYFSTDLKITYSDIRLPYMEISGNSFEPGAALRLAVSRKIFDTIKITPYINITYDFKTTKVKLKVTRESSTDPNNGTQYDYTVGETGESMINGTDGIKPDAGMNFTYETESSFSFGASIGGYLSSYTTNYYNDALYKKMKYKYISFFIGYKM